MVQQVLSVLPHVPVIVIQQDLSTYDPYSLCFVILSSLTDSVFVLKSLSLSLRILGDQVSSPFPCPRPWTSSPCPCL